MMNLFNSPIKPIFFLFSLLNLALALNYPSFNGFFSFSKQCLIILGYQFCDLTTQNIDTFYLETQKWTVSGLIGTANSSLCGSNNPLLGGYGILSNGAGMSKIYTSLPTHNALYYQITFNLIDKFKTPDYFTLKLDSTSISGGSSLSTYNSYLTTSTCGASDPDTTQFTITGSMPHTASTLNFQSTIKLTGSGTLGIRDIQLTFVNDSSVTTATSCFRVFDSQLLGLSGECSCVKGSYSSSGTCTTCNPACQNCFGSSASECFACAAGYSFNGTQCLKCDSSCLTCTGPGSLQCVTCQTGYWLQLNASCTATCDLPTSASQVVGSLQLCYPACNTSQYFVWDGTCANNCSSPLVNATAGANKLCNKPCNTGEYLYWNGSCIAGCSAPLNSSSLNGVDTCNKPCQTGESLYWNGSCIAGCSTPLLSSSTSDGVLMCNKPCQTGEYFDWNSTCVIGCGTPLVSSTTSDGVLVCNKPCQNSDYLYGNGSCIAECSAPFNSSSSNGVDTCNKPCQTGESLYWNGSCITGCNTPLVSSTNDSVLTCNMPCQPGEYLYWNGSCLAGCPSPLLFLSALDTVLACNKPCNPGEYLDWNNTCISICSNPLVSSISNNNVSLCNKPCDNNEFLDWNNTCTASCPAPLVSSTNNSVALCNKPCQNNEFLYYNGSCLSTCPSPFVSSSSMNVDLCQLPCVNSQFLYPNGSCSVQCPAPLVSSTTTDGVLKCGSPCASLSSYYYYNTNNTCGASCSSPGTIQMIEFLQVCLIPPQPAPSQGGGLSPNQKNSVDQSNALIQAAGAAASAGTVTSSIISPPNAGAVTLISLIKMLEYIRYMKIDYPPKLEYMMLSQNQGSISLNLNVNLPQSVERKFPDYPLPENFEKYHMVSSFVVNYWKALLTLGILLLILAASMFTASKAKDVKYLGMYSGKIRDIIKWNFFLIVLCGNTESVGVFSSLELRTAHFNSFLSVFGTLVCIFINLLVLYLMLLIPYIIYSLRRARGKISPGDQNPQREGPKRFAFCGVLFMNFREKSVLQHSCMFFILLRVYFFNVIIGYLFDYPLTQAILITTMSFLMLGYFSITRPYKNPLELVKILTYEAIIAVVNICVLILAVMDHRGIKNKETRVKLGDAIIVSNIVFNAMAVFYMGVELVIKIIKVYKRRKTITAKGWRYWFTIATFLLEPEELEMEEDRALKKEKPVLRVPTKPEEKPPKKMVPFLSQTPLDDQADQDSEVVMEKSSPMPIEISSSALRLNMGKIRISKVGSIISFGGWNNDVSSGNLLTPPTEKTGVFFPHGPSSARSLLRSQDDQSAPSSPRIELQLSSRLTFQDLENNRLASDSVNLGSPGKLDEDKGMLVSRNRSSEVFFPYKDRRRNVRLSQPNSAIIDNNESGTDLSFEAGAGTERGMNSSRQQSRFSRFLPEKAKNLQREEEDVRDPNLSGGNCID